MNIDCLICGELLSKSPSVKVESSLSKLFEVNRQRGDYSSKMKVSHLFN